MTGPTSEPEAGSEAVADVELMRYLDGELDEASEQRVADAIERDSGLRAKLAGLEAVATLVREAVAGETRGDGVVDAVMMQLAAGQEQGAAVEGPVGDGAGASQTRGEGAGRLQRGHPPAGRPANDNARLIYGFAALAAAIAAGMLLWARVEPDQPAAHHRLPPRTALAQAEPAGRAAAATGAEAPAASTAEDEPAGVEIAAVDFGAQSGTVFYVSGGRSATGATAVVWVTDAGD